MISIFEVTKFEHAVIEKIQSKEPIRSTKELENGNIAILQIVDPSNVPQFARSLRQRKSPIGKFLMSLEAAIRVGIIVFKNSMKKEVIGHK